VIFSYVIWCRYRDNQKHLRWAKKSYLRFPLSVAWCCWCKFTYLFSFRLFPRSGVGNLFTITGRIKCALSLAGRKINWFYPHILPLSNYEEERLLLAYYLTTCLSWCLVLKRCCTLTWVRKIMLRAISSVYAGRRFPTPGLDVKLLIFG